MTLIETPVTIDFALDLGDELPHIECCRKEAFLCGKEHHPELTAVKTDPECCKTCIAILEQSLCPAFRPTHVHCPLSEKRSIICPTGTVFP